MRETDFTAGGYSDRRQGKATVGKQRARHRVPSGAVTPAMLEIIDRGDVAIGVDLADLKLQVGVSLAAEVGPRPDLAVDESVIKCPSPLHVLKDTYDHSCY